MFFGCDVKMKCLDCIHYNVCYDVNECGITELPNCENFLPKLVYKRIPADQIKEGDKVQYAAVYILNLSELRQSNIEVHSYFVEVN